MNKFCVLVINRMRNFIIFVSLKKIKWRKWKKTQKQ